MNRPYRILVTGNRHWDDTKTITDALWKAAYTALVGAGLSPEQIVVVHGGATGADSIAHQVAHRHGFTTEVHPADWSRGRGAGPERNERMVAAGADVCLAFPIGASPGTRNCMRLAEEAGIPVIVHELTSEEAR